MQDISENVAFIMGDLKLLGYRLMATRSEEFGPGFTMQTSSRGVRDMSVLLRQEQAEYGIVHSATRFTGYDASFYFSAK